MGVNAEDIAEQRILQVLDEVALDAGRGPVISEHSQRQRLRRAEPFVAAGDEEVAAKPVHGEILGAKTVDTIDAEQGAVPLIPIGVYLSKSIGDPAKGQLQPGAGVNIGDGHDPRPRSYLPYE